MTTANTATIGVYNKSSGFINVGTISWYFDGSYLFAGTEKTVLFNDGKKAVIEVNKSGDKANLTLLDGVPFFTMINTTVASASNSYVNLDDTNDDANMTFYFKNGTYESVPVANLALNPVGAYYGVIVNPTKARLMFAVVNKQPTENPRNRVTTGGLIDWRYNVTPLNTFMAFGVLDNVNLSQSGNTASNYSWDSWSPKSTNMVLDTDANAYLIYHFNEGSGSTVDNAQGNATLDLTMSNATFSQSKRVYGYQSTAGSVSNYSYGTGAKLSYTNLSIFAWVKLNSFGVDNLVVFSQGTDYYSGITFFVKKSNAYFIQFKNSSVGGYSGGYYGAGTTWKLNTWYHVGFTFDYSTKNLTTYTNGVVGTSQIITSYNTIVPDSTNFYLGNKNYFDWGLDGQIDEFYLVERVLNQSEITALYGVGLPDALDNRYSNTYGGYTTTDSFAELFANNSIAIKDFTDSENYLGVNSSYFTRSVNYNLPTNNDWGINNVTNKLLTWTSHYNPYPNYQMNLSGVLYQVRNNCDVPQTITSAWNVTGYWSLNETTGYTTANNTISSQANTNFTMPDDSQWHTSSDCIKGGCYEFSDDTASTIALNSNFSTTNFAICLWLKIPTTGDYGIIGRATSSEWISSAIVDWRLKSTSSNTLSFTGIGTIGSYTPNTWTHTCITFNSSNNNITSYVNGLKTNSLNYYINNTDQTKKLILSGRDDSLLSGYIDEVIMINRTITSGEVYNLYTTKDPLTTITTGTTNTCLVNYVYYTNTTKPIVGDCEVLSFGNETIKYTVTDEKTNDDLNDTTIESDYTLLDYNITYGIKTEDKGTYTMCVYPNNSIRVNTTIRYYADNYVTRYHFLNNATLTTTLRSLTLYTLDNISDTQVNLRVRDNAGTDVPNVLIIARREFVSEASFKSVGMCITDSEGTCSIPLELNNVRYDFQAFNLTTNSLIKSTASTILTTSNIDPAVIISITTGSIFDYWSKKNQLVYNVTNITVTDFVNYTVNALDLTGLATSIKLTCTKNGMLGDTQVYSGSVNSNSASLTCQLGNITNNRYSVITIITYLDGTKITLTESVDGTVPYNYSTDGLISAFFILLSLGLAFAITPSAGILGIITGLVIINGLGFTLLKTDTIMMLVFALFFILWVLGRKR